MKDKKENMIFKKREYIGVGERTFILLCSIKSEREITN